MTLKQLSDENLAEILKRQVGFANGTLPQDAVVQTPEEREAFLLSIKDELDGNDL